MNGFSRTKYRSKVAFSFALQPVLASSLIVLAASLLAVVGLFVHGFRHLGLATGDTLIGIGSSESSQLEMLSLQLAMAEYEYFSTRILLAAGFLLLLLAAAGVARWLLLKKRWGSFGGHAAQPREKDEPKEPIGNQLRSKIGHELRNPISAVISCLEAAMTDNLVGQNIGVRRAHRASLDMLDLLNRMLDASRLAEQKLCMQPESFSLKSLLRKATEAAVIQAHRKNIALLVDLPPDTPDLMHGDAFRLRQVLVNLISNAIKFTEEGQVILGASHRKIDSSHIELSLRVQDTGCGISEAQMQSLFKAYGQHEGQAGSKFGGSGLGLYICKELVEQMGGQIQVRSFLGEGTTFLITLPLELRQAGGAPMPGPQKDTALVIVASISAERILLEKNLSPYFGKTFIHSSLSGLSGNHFPADSKVYLLVSLDTPGRVALQSDNLHLRQDFQLPKAERTVLVAGGLASCRQQASDQRLRPDAVLASPALPAEILDALFSGVANAQVSEPLATSQALLRGIRVLLAEDTATLREVTSETLRSWGADVQCVSNGNEAVACALSGNKQFDVVLMDVDMPFMNGMEATRRIRNCFNPLQLPVIALTSHDMEVQVQACLSSGMNVHQAKPVNFNELAQLILKFKSQHRPGHAQEPALDPSGGGLKSGSPIYLNGLAHFEAEYSAWLENSGGSKELDRSCVHQLRGAASLLGAHTLSALCRQFEVGWEAATKEETTAAAAQIRAELKRVLQSIRQCLKHEVIQ